MLNIKEIKSSKKELPVAVLEAREKILSSFNELVFIEEGHKYFLHGNELLSVSVITHQFKPHVDWDEVCKKKAIKEGVDFEELKESWHYNNIMATNSGTHVHEYGESWFYFSQGEEDKVIDMFKRQIEDGYFLPNSPKEEAVSKFYEWFFRMPNLYPVLAETRVYTEKYAGTFDLLTYYEHPTNKDLCGFIIMDFKTNGNLYSDFNRKNFKVLLPPFTDLIDEDLGMYTLQLSSYQIPLETIGLKVIGRRIIWLKPDGSYELIGVGNKTNELRKAFGLVGDED